MPILKTELDHYTAVVKIFRVDKQLVSETSHQSRSIETTVDPKKESTEVASINIRSNDLIDLVTKAVAHLNLVEDNT